ncbi:unnamed protein product [Chrysoparadoxa australica]
MRIIAMLFIIKLLGAYAFIPCPAGPAATIVVEAKKDDAAMESVRPSFPLVNFPLMPMRSRFGDMIRDLEKEFFGEDTMEIADSTWGMPLMDIKENDKSYAVTIDLPGVNKDDLNVEIKDGVMTISAERKSEKEEKGETFHRMERSFGKMQRSVVLPLNVNQDKVHYSFHLHPFHPFHSFHPWPLPFSSMKLLLRMVCLPSTLRRQLP